MNWTAVSFYVLGWIWFYADIRASHNTSWWVAVKYGMIWPFTVLILLAVRVLPDKWFPQDPPAQPWMRIEPATFKENK